MGRILVGWLLVGLTVLAAPRVLHVATNGNDGWSGTLAVPNAAASDGPLATLEGARDAVKRLRVGGDLPLGGVEIVVQGGWHRLNRTFELTREDSGTARAPITYRAAAGVEVRLTGSRRVTGFKTVTESAVRSRLDEAARGQVVQANLRDLGVNDQGTAGGGGLAVFFRDQPMRLARWPNSGFVKIAEVLGPTPVDVRGTTGTVEGVFTFEGDRPTRWSAENDAWLHGYWFWDWSDQRQRVKAIDLERRTVELEPPYHGYGYRRGQWYYAYNLLSEIDQPGEWYLDRPAGVLYFWPPAPVDSGSTEVSVLSNLVSLVEVSHTAFEGFVLEAVRGTAVTISGGASNRVLGCTIRNVGESAVNVSGGVHHAVVSCDVYHCGAGGIGLSGGDRKTLTSAGHVADNNHVHEYGRWRPMYSAGISLQGVGLRATHNRIHHAPHQAIGFGGNDHVIELNEIHDVCQESNDAGAVYAGRDWTMRGTVIRHNYFHDITGFEGRGCVGVYLDDMFCGTAITGNLFVRVTSAAFIGGGRDCQVENNIFVDCSPALHVDARALGWAKYHADEWVKEGEEKGTLSGTAYREPPYRGRYPGLDTILDDDPRAPRGNVVARNVVVGGRWEDVEGKARPLLKFQNNLVDVEPRFVDRAAGNFQLRPDSPAWALGFQKIPIDQIGLYRDTNATRQ